MYSSSGEPIARAAVNEHDLTGLYAWIAGESKVVTTLRRCMVKELEVDRRQVAVHGVLATRRRDAFLTTPPTTSRRKDPVSGVHDFVRVL